MIMTDTTSEDGMRTACQISYPNDRTRVITVTQTLPDDEIWAEVTTS